MKRSAPRGYSARAIEPIAQLPQGKMDCNVSRGQAITVWWRSTATEVGLGARGTVDLSFIDGKWWVNRALVQGDPKIRSKGIGSTLLQTALGHVVAEGGTQAFVCPGGYGSDTRRQQRFYEQNGFVRKGDVWVWALDSNKPPPVPLLKEWADPDMRE